MGHVFLMEDHNCQEDKPNIQVYVMSANIVESKLGGLSPELKEGAVHSAHPKAVAGRCVYNFLRKKKMKNSGEFLIYEATVGISFLAFCSIFYLW